MEPLEPTRIPWAQGVGRSNRPAPTKPCIYNMLGTMRERAFQPRAHVAGAVDRQSSVEKHGLLLRITIEDRHFLAFGIYIFDYNPVYFTREPISFNIDGAG